MANPIDSAVMVMAIMAIYFATTPAPRRDLTADCGKILRLPTCDKCLGRGEDQ